MNVQKCPQIVIRTFKICPHRIDVHAVAGWSVIRTFLRPVNLLIGRCKDVSYGQSDASDALANSTLQKPNTTYFLHIHKTSQVGLMSLGINVVIRKLYRTGYSARDGVVHAPSYSIRTDHNNQNHTLPTNMRHGYSLSSSIPIPIMFLLS